MIIHRIRKKRSYFLSILGLFLILPYCNRRVGNPQQKGIRCFLTSFRQIGKNSFYTLKPAERTNFTLWGDKNHSGEGIAGFAFWVFHGIQQGVALKERSEYYRKKRTMYSLAGPQYIVSWKQPFAIQTKRYLKNSSD